MRWQEKAYGVVVIILILWMLIDLVINGRTVETKELW